MDEDNFLNEILHDINLEKELKLQLPENHLDQNNFEDGDDKNSEKYTKKRSFDTILSLLDDGLFLPSNLDVNLSNFDDIEMDVMSDIKIGNLNNSTNTNSDLGKMDVEEILSLKNLEMSTREGQNQKIEKENLQQNQNQNLISNTQKLTPKMKRNYHCDDLCEQNSTKTELTSGFGSIYEYGYNNVEDWLEMNLEHMSEENAQKLTAESEAETKNLHLNQKTQETQIQTPIQPMISCNQNPSIINLDRIGCGGKSCSAIGPTSNTSIIRYDCTYPIQPITLSNSSSLNFTPIDYNYKQTDFSQNPDLLAPQISLDTLKKQNKSGKNSRNKIPNRRPVPMNSNRPIIISYLPNYTIPHVTSNSNFTVVSYVNDNPNKQNIPNLPKNKEKKNEEKENFKIKQSKLPLEMDLDELTNKIYDLPPELNNPMSKDYDPKKIDLHEKNYFEDSKIVNSKTNFSKWQTIMEVVYPNSPITTNKVAQDNNDTCNVMEKETSENDDIMEEICSNSSAQINKIRKVQPLTKTDGTKRLPTLRKIELDSSKTKKRRVSYNKNNHVTNNNSFVNLQPLTIQPIHSTTSRRIIKGSDNISYEEIYFYDDNKNLCKALCPLPRKINNHSKSSTINKGTKNSKLSSNANVASNNLQMGWSHHKKIVNQGQEVHVMGRTSI